MLRRPGDDLPDTVPMFVSRRVDPLTPSAKGPKGFAGDAVRSAWHRGFRSGVVATVGGLCLVVAVIWLLLDGGW